MANARKALFDWGMGTMALSQELLRMAVGEVLIELDSCESQLSTVTDDRDQIKAAYGLLEARLDAMESTLKIVTKQRDNAKKVQEGLGELLSRSQSRLDNALRCLKEYDAAEYPDDKVQDAILHLESDSSVERITPENPEPVGLERIVDYIYIQLSTGIHELPRLTDLRLLGKIVAICKGIDEPKFTSRMQAHKWLIDNNAAAEVSLEDQLTDAFSK